MRFAEECGIPDGLRLLLRSDDASTWHGFHVKEPYALIGKSSGCNIQLTDNGIANVHAYLQVLDDNLFVCDLTENRGVLVNDYAVTADWVDHKSSFQLGRYELKIDAGDRPTDGEIVDVAIESGDNVRELSEEELEALDEADPNEFESAAGLILSMRSPHGRKQRVRSAREVSLVGRSKSCKFALGSTSVSNFHCSLVRTQESVWLIDLESHAGTRLNGQPVHQARVPDRARLQVGRCRLTIDLQRANEIYDTDRDRTHALIPYSPMSPASASWTEQNGPSEDLIRDLVADVASSQQSAFEQARAMLVELIGAQERMHALQLEASQAQNSQLLEVIRMLTGSQNRPSSAGALMQPDGSQPPLIAQPPIGPQPTQSSPQAQPTTTAVDPVNVSDGSPIPSHDAASTPETSAAHHEVDGPAPSSEAADPEIHNAWVRGQLHVISENLKKEQERGVKRLLKGLMPGRSDDALK